jgi:hypothetical protein
MSDKVNSQTEPITQLHTPSIRPVMTISHEEPDNPNSPNWGMNVKAFLISVFVAAIVVFGILYIAVARKGTTLVPTPAQTTGPTSQLTRPKPSPLHSQALRVATRPPRPLDHLDP